MPVVKVYLLAVSGPVETILIHHASSSQWCRLRAGVGCPRGHHRRDYSRIGMQYPTPHASANDTRSELLRDSWRTCEIMIRETVAAARHFEISRHGTVVLVPARVLLCPTGTYG